MTADSTPSRLPRRLAAALVLLAAAAPGAARAGSKPAPSAATVLIGDLYGTGEHREPARGLSMVLRAAVRDAGKGRLDVVPSARLDEVSGKARVLHVLVAQPWLKATGAQFGVGGLIEPDGGGVRLVLRVYDAQGRVLKVRGVTSPGSDYHQLATGGLAILAEELGIKPIPLPWFGGSDLGWLGNAAFALEAAEPEAALVALERAVRNRPAVEQLTRGLENLGAGIASHPKAAMWLKLRGQILSGKPAAALEDARIWRRDRPRDVLAGSIEARALMGLGRHADAEKLLRELPETAETLLLRGQCLRDLRRPRDAEGLLDRASKLGTDTGAALLALADVQVALKDAAASRKLGEAAERLLKVGEVALAQGAAVRALQLGGPADPALLLVGELAPRERALVATALKLPADGALAPAELRVLSQLPAVSKSLTPEDARDFGALAPATPAGKGEGRPLDVAKGAAGAAPTGGAAGAPGTAGTAGAPAPPPPPPAPGSGETGNKALMAQLDVELSNFRGGGAQAATERSASRRLYQAHLLLHAGKVHQARAVAVAAATDPKAASDPQLQQLIGRSYLEANQPAPAARALEAGGAARGGEAGVRMLARAYEQSGEPERALQLHQQGARERVLKDPEVQRARALQSLAGGDVAAAKGHIARAIELNPQDITNYQVAAAVERRLGNSLEAAQLEGQGKALLAGEAAIAPRPPLRALGEAKSRDIAKEKSPEARSAKRNVKDLSKSPLVQALLENARVKALAESDAAPSVAIVVRPLAPELALWWILGLRADEAELRTELTTSAKLVLPSAKVTTAISPDLVRAAEGLGTPAIQDAARADNHELVLVASPAIVLGGQNRVRLEVRAIHTATGLEPPRAALLDEGRYLRRDILPSIGVGIGGLVVLALLVLAVARLRRAGTLVVTVKYDTTAESGLFSLVLSRRRKDVKLKGGDEAYVDEVRKSGSKTGKRYATMIKPVTTFEGLPTGRWYVYLYGVYIRLGKPDGNYVVEKEFVISPSETTMVDFDLVGENATLLVDVWDEAGPVPKALVTIDGDMDHGIYTGDRGGGAVFLLKPGEYTIEAAKGSKASRTTFRCEHPRPYHVTLRFDEPDEMPAPTRRPAPEAADLPDYDYGSGGGNR